ncbi:translation initiation factor IF-2-like [Microtus oregoni]|uniref:translation initiation factor IF-2-like n=1 Tax=Microtus oregoni TaxID=111838 RepID=UPI001BB2BA41|nr:translation initiation factor IF-2-like [Microtus oregoni]
MAAGGEGGRGCNPLGAGPWLCTSGSIPGAWCRTRISSRSAGPGGAGRSTCGRSLAARPARRPQLQLSLSAAPWLPAPSRRRAAPRHLRGSATRALPAGSTELPDLRVRPQRRPENGRRLLGPSAPFHPVQAGGRLDLERMPRPQGGCGSRGSSPPVPPLQSRLGQDCGVTEQALGTGRRPREPRSCAV